MKRDEILLEMEMDYETLVDYLLEKYGRAKYDYFTNETCKSQNRNVSRTKEGLYCHHIDENKGVNLSERSFAVGQPFEYQKAERLVYCNLFEHLLLHIQIGKDEGEEMQDKASKSISLTAYIMPGTMYICQSINDLYEKDGSKMGWLNRCYEEIKWNFDDYIYILKSFIEYLENQYKGEKNEEYEKMINTIKKILSAKWDKKILRRVYDKL